MISEGDNFIVPFVKRWLKMVVSAVSDRIMCGSTSSGVPCTVEGVDVVGGLASNGVDDIEIGPPNSSGVEHVVKPESGLPRKWNSLLRFSFSRCVTNEEGSPVAGLV